MQCENCKYKDETIQAMLDACTQLSAVADQLQAKNKMINSRVIAQKIYEVLYAQDDD